MQPRRKIKLMVENVPPIEKASIEIPAPGITVIVGPNASGKTKLVLSLSLADDALRAWREERQRGYPPPILWLDPDAYVPGIGSDWRIELVEYENQGAWVPYARIRIKPRKVNGHMFVDTEGEPHVGYYKNLIPKTFVPPFRALLSLLPMVRLDKLPWAYRQFFTNVSLAVSEKPIVVDSECLDFKLIYDGRSIVFEQDGKRLSWYEVASGWNEYAPLLLAIALEKQPKPTRLITIEEPEAHLHPGALKCILDNMIKLMKNGYAFMITTHDPLVIEYLDLKLLSGEVDPQSVKIYAMVFERRGTTSVEVPVREGLGIERDPILEVLEETKLGKVSLLLGENK